MATYTFIPKPIARTYTKINPVGKEQYDQSQLTYDDASTFYDGINMSQYTKIAKPTGTSSGGIKVGMATGLITPPTYSTAHGSTADLWTRISKPN